MNFSSDRFPHPGHTHIPTAGDEAGVGGAGAWRGGWAGGGILGEPVPAEDTVAEPVAEHFALVAAVGAGPEGGAQDEANTTSPS